MFVVNQCRFNIETTVQVVDTIQDIEVFIVAQNNELFARVPLNGQLNEDTDAGKPHSLMMLMSVCLSVCHCDAFVSETTSEMI